MKINKKEWIKVHGSLPTCRNRMQKTTNKNSKTFVAPMHHVSESEYIINSVYSTEVFKSFNFAVAAYTCRYLSVNLINNAFVG